MGFGAEAVGKIIRSVKVYRSPLKKNFPVCEVKNLQEMRDKCLELMRGTATAGAIMPLSHQAIVREGSGAFMVGERVVHIGSLEPVYDLFLARISTADVDKDSDGRSTWIALESMGDLFEGPIPTCSVCHLPFLSTERRSQIFMDDETCIEYCDKCQAVLADIAAKLAEKKPV